MTFAPEHRLDGEERLSFRQLSRRLHSRPHPRTVQRWAMNGIQRRRIGDVVKLEYGRDGKGLFTSWEPYKRFEAALNDPRNQKWYYVARQNKNR